jgi:hypothetical protein
MIFNRIISPSRQYFGNLCPSASIRNIMQIQDPLLLVGPTGFIYHGVQMIMPTSHKIILNRNKNYKTNN